MWDRPEPLFVEIHLSVYFFQAKSIVYIHEDQVLGGINKEFSNHFFYNIPPTS